MTTFDTFALPDALLASLKSMKFETPTPIQAETIPHALQGKDVFGTAQTGTGKTLAYVIPLIAHLLNSPYSSALVLTPTRELALQVLTVCKQLLTDRNIQPTLLIGGDSMTKQLSQLSRKPRLFVGTPGRINDHLARKSLKIDKVDFVVFDETDRMLDMGFSIQLERIAQYLPAKRQMLMFSATITPTIVKISQTYLKDEIRLAIGSTTAPIAKIKQEILHIKETEKYDQLLKQLEISTGSFVVFVKTKFATERLAKRLCEDNHEADAIHGDLRQRNRERVIQDFRNGKHRILVATDVAARGLDIPHIECIVNYDLPQCPEDYIHRIGRTGRAGAEGRAISFVSSADGVKWKVIYKMMNPGEKFHEQPGSRSTQPSKKTFRKVGYSRNVSEDSDRPARKTTERSFERTNNYTAKPERRSSPKTGYGTKDNFADDRPSRKSSENFYARPGSKPSRPDNKSFYKTGATAKDNFSSDRPARKSSENFYARPESKPSRPDNKSFYKTGATAKDNFSSDRPARKSSENFYARPGSKTSRPDNKPSYKTGTTAKDSFAGDRPARKTAARSSDVTKNNSGEDQNRQGAGKPKTARNHRKNSKPFFAA